MPGELDDLLEIKPKSEEQQEGPLEMEQPVLEQLDADAPQVETPEVTVQAEPEPVRELPQPELPDPVEPEPKFIAESTHLEDAEITYSPSRVSNYAVLKNLAKFLKVLAWIFGLGGIAAMLYSIQFYEGDWGRPENEFFTFLFIGIGTLPGVVPLVIAAESINVMLDVEANTRQAAKTLERLLKSQ